MNSEELAEVVTALHGLCMAQAGQVAALQVTLEALIATIGVNLPPLTAQVSQHIEGLAPLAANDLDPSSLPSFSSTISTLQNNLRILQGA
ncbi:MAG: hypothetical protein JSR23_11120 [Proteobacteria bacterium]|nr:hypothetical protein [Pseudomonadota bacterium]